MTLSVLFFPLLSFSQSPCDPKAGPQDSCQGCGGGGTAAPNPGDPHWPIQIVRSKDPNDVVGPTGYQAVQWVSVNDKLQYTVHFENDPVNATAPAQNVYIHIPAHPGINLNSLKLVGFGFGSHHYTIPAGSSIYTAQLDLVDSLGLFVNVTAGINILANEVLWSFNSIDPITHLPPISAQVGFLPVNDSMLNDSIQGKGEGYVTFLLSPKQSLLTGDTVSEQASIVFDANDPLATNVWTNTIDAFAPTSHINGYTVSNDTIFFHFSGIDDPGGIGLKDYSIYLSENNGPFLLYKSQVTDTFEVFTGILGSTYRFFSLSRDTVNNIEALKNVGEIIVPLTGTPLPLTWLYFEGVRQGSAARLNWATASEHDCKNYIVERSLDGMVFSEIGIVVANGDPQSNNYEYWDWDMTRFNVTKIFYRLRQVKKDYSFTYSKTVVLLLGGDNKDVSVSAYPNPFSKNISLQVLNVSASGTSDYVALFSMDGRLRYQRKLTFQGGATILLDDMPELEQGIYLLKTVIQNKQYVVKLTKQ